MKVYTCKKCGREGWYGQDSFFSHYCWWTPVMRFFKLEPSGSGSPGPVTTPTTSVTDATATAAEPNPVLDPATLEAKVVRAGDVYYLQIRSTHTDWEYACGYHRGAPGMYHYQFCTASNPYYHVEYTLPEVLQELRNPTLSEVSVQAARRNRPRLPPQIDGIYPIHLLEAAMAAHPQGDILTKYPAANLARQEPSL